MKYEAGQLIVVASRDRVRWIPASLLVVRATVDIDLEAELARFVAQDPAGPGDVMDGPAEKLGLQFINWAIRAGLVELVSPLPAVFDLQVVGGQIQEGDGASG